MATQLPQDFKEFLQLLDSERIEYLVVGGIAVSYYGYPRPTGDLHVWIAMDPANASRLGVEVDMISKQDLLANKRAAGRPKDANDLEHLDA